MMHEILIITDSRGNNMKTNILKQNTRITVSVLKGADLDNGYEILSIEIDVNIYDVIYVVFGVNNLYLYRILYTDQNFYKNVRLIIIVRVGTT